MLSRSDEYILLAVWQLQHTDNGAYGTSILTFLELKSSSTWSIAGVYAPLKRLARKGLLTSRIGIPTPERGGKRKRIYELTKLGVSILSETRSEAQTLWAAALHDLPRASVSL